MFTLWMVATIVSLVVVYFLLRVLYPAERKEKPQKSPQRQKSPRDS